MGSEFNGMRYRATFRCGYCKTEVEFADQAPDWQEDPRMVAARERAEAFVAQYAGRQLPQYGGTMPVAGSEEEAFAVARHELAEFVMSDWNGKIVPELREVDVRVFPCPTCNAWIRPKDGIGA